MSTESNEQLKREVWEYISTEVRPFKKRGSDKLSVRCPYCGDSTHQDSTHLYISFPFHDPETPMLFHCFLCSTSGIVNSDLMRNLGVTDLNVNGRLRKYNNEIQRKQRSLGWVGNTIHAKIPIPDETDIRNQQKKAYLEDRMGTRISWEELVNLKVVFRLGDYLELNDIEKITCPPPKARMLHDDYVGFATTHNEFITFRRVNDNAKGKRHEVYNVFPNLDNTRKIYTIPTSVDIVSNEPIVINVTEGVMDLWGVYFHLNDREISNHVYLATLGSNFVNPVTYFIRKGIIGERVTVNIFSDADHNPYFYRKLVQKIKPWVGEVNLYYNGYLNEKDFGVPKHRITLEKRRIPS